MVRATVEKKSTAFEPRVVITLVQSITVSAPAHASRTPVPAYASTPDDRCARTTFSPRRSRSSARSAPISPLAPNTTVVIGSTSSRIVCLLGTQHRQR
ncbi:Uncharacterised protein [Mycobacteroides abscessus subsp. abscessus]|nr:Uncharacterised protein [Mycobacteroides abscessus subsp. abscessus]